MPTSNSRNPKSAFKSVLDPDPFLPENGKLFSIDLMKQNRDYHLQGWPITVVDIPIYQQQKCYFHSHDSMEIGIITEGRAVHVMDGKRTEVHPGDVLLIPPKRNHAYDAVEGDELKRNIVNINGRKYEEVCIPLGILNILYDHRKLPIPLLDGQSIPLYSSFFPNNVEEMTYTADPIMHIPDPAMMEFIRSCANELHKEEIYPYMGNLFGSTIRLLNLILTLLRNSNIHSAPYETVADQQLGTILDFVNANYMKKFTVGDLARKCFISPRQLQEKFKKYTGRSISDYVVRKRIEAAELLLKKGIQSIQEIAFNCGFNDFSYFSKKFREITGKTPREYRNNSFEKII